LVRPPQKRVVVAAEGVVVVARLQRRVAAAAEVVPLRQQADNAVLHRQTHLPRQLRSLLFQRLRLVTLPMPTPVPLRVVVVEHAAVVAAPRQQPRAEQPRQPVDAAAQQQRLPVQL
jgi:hypothetical protein